MPYQIEEDPETPGLWLVTNLYSQEQYWTNMRNRICDCPSYEFVVSDYQGGFCKHMQGIQKWLKTGTTCSVAIRQEPTGA